MIWENTRHKAKVDIYVMEVSELFDQTWTSDCSNPNYEKDSKNKGFKIHNSKVKVPKYEYHMVQVYDGS